MLSTLTRLECDSTSAARTDPFDTFLRELAEATEEKIDLQFIIFLMTDSKYAFYRKEKVYLA